MVLCVIIVQDYAVMCRNSGSFSPKTGSFLPFMLKTRVLTIKHVFINEENYLINFITWFVVSVFILAK